MYSIKREGSDYIIYHKAMNLELERFDNQRETLEQFNLMNMVLAVDMRIPLSTAEIISLDKDVIVVGNMLGDRVHNILSPIFDNVLEANKFLETTVCECGFDIGIRALFSKKVYCDTCAKGIEK